jgi:hypothetical protein
MPGSPKFGEDHAPTWLAQSEALRFREGETRTANAVRQPPSKRCRGGVPTAHSFPAQKRAVRACPEPFGFAQGRLREGALPLQLKNLFVCYFRSCGRLMG